MKKHIVQRIKMLSYVAAGLVGFSLGVGNLVLGGGAFILAIIFDLISGIIEQNKKDVQIYDRD